jgi:uncharacterized membrane protein
MDGVTIARSLHVLAVVLWIGGVGFVTTVLFPALRRLPNPALRAAVFGVVERHFSAQARLSVVLVGLSGLYMLTRLNVWDRFTSLTYWWMHAMVLTWLVFATMLFVLEPLLLHRRFVERAKDMPEAMLRTIQRFHMVLLALSLLTILGAVAGSHGLLLFD